MDTNLSRQPALTYDQNVDGRPLQPEERERIMNSLLPNTFSPDAAHSASSQVVSSGKGLNAMMISIIRVLRNLFLLLIFKLAFYALQLSFSLHSRFMLLCYGLRARLWSILYYHHRSSEIIRRDVAALPRLPRHLSVIVDLPQDCKKGGDHDWSQLLSDIAELCAWCASVKIPQLSIYERDGAIKDKLSELSVVTSKIFGFYFPRSAMPAFNIASAQETTRETKKIAEMNPAPSSQANIDVILLSANDGRGTVVDLTRTLTEMSQRGKIQTGEVSVELIDTELAEASCGDPDLLIMMTNSRQLTDFHWRSYIPKLGLSSPKKHWSYDSDITKSHQIATGSEVCLRGYPPWQARLTEIFSRTGGSGIEYQTFLEALHKYAKAEMRLGR